MGTYLTLETSPELAFSLPKALVKSPNSAVPPVKASDPPRGLKKSSDGGTDADDSFPKISDSRSEEF